MIINLSSSSAPAKLGASNFILHETGFRHHWEGVGALSLKSFFKGQALYEVGNGRYRIDARSFLLLNHHQPYRITLDAGQAAESFCLFFAEGFAEEVQRSLTTATRRLLDEPELRATASLQFFERTYPREALLSPVLARMRGVLLQKHYARGWMQEQFHLLMQQLLQVQRGAYKEAAALPAARAATREELYRRLHRARDFMQASWQQPLALEELARVACLSPNHFLRSFRQLFHQTPHQYLTALRLAQARHLLTHTEHTVTDICFALGFESLGSFSLLCAKHLGASPSRYRRQKK
ncbi:MAG: AraC family transcriptional regulator [candidate division KSB1 bacterium]